MLRAIYIALRLPLFLGLAGLVGFQATKAWRYFETWDDLRDIEDALEPGEVPVLVGMGGVLDGRLYVLCLDSAPNRLLASWVPPMRRSGGSPRVGWESGYEIGATIVASSRIPGRFKEMDVPETKLFVGMNRDLQATKRLEDSMVQDLSELLSRGVGWTYSLWSMEQRFRFSLVGRANEGLDAVCGNAA